MTIIINGYFYIITLDKSKARWYNDNVQDEGSAPLASE